KSYKSIDITTMDGKVVVQDATIQTITASVGDGVLEMENVTGTSLIMELRDGKIAGKGMRINNIDANMLDELLSFAHIESDDIKAVTVDGKIQMKDVSGNLDAKVRDGTISLKTNHVERQMTLMAEDGNIHIDSDKAPENVEFDVDVSDGFVDLFGKYNASTI